MFFIRFKDSKEVHKSLISDRQLNVQCIEKVIRAYEAIDKFYRRYPCPTKREKDLAEKLVSDVQGVKQVVNNITVG